MSGRGVLGGRYEPERFEALAGLVRPEDVFWDIGAHHGYATLIAARIVGERGRVLAFEPSASNRWYLNRHLGWNGETNVQVFGCAIADAERTDVIGGTGSSVSFRLGHPGDVVEVRSVSGLLESGLPFPTFLKIDVEGAEAMVLEGAATAMRVARARGQLPTLLVSVHTPELMRSCLELLMPLGYSVTGSRPIVEFLAGSEWRGDPDLLAFPNGHEAPSVGKVSWFTSSPHW